MKNYFFSHNHVEHLNVRRRHLHVLGTGSDGSRGGSSISQPMNFGKTLDRDSPDTGVTWHVESLYTASFTALG